MVFVSESDSCLIMINKDKGYIPLNKPNRLTRAEKGI